MVNKIEIMWLELNENKKVIIIFYIYHCQPMAAS